MSPLTVSRIIFVLLWVNEFYVLSRSSAEERAAMPIGPSIAISFVLLVLPFFIAIAYPDWLGWLIVIGQVVCLAMEVAGEIQLSRAKSFSINAKVPMTPQKDGLYRFMENPIYIALLLHFAIWGIWMPLVWIGVAMQYMVVRKMVKAERSQLAAIQFVHRKFDSILWN